MSETDDTQEVSIKLDSEELEIIAECLEALAHDENLPQKLEKLGKLGSGIVATNLAELANRLRGQIPKDSKPNSYTFLSCSVEEGNWIIAAMFHIIDQIDTDRLEYPEIMRWAPAKCLQLSKLFSSVLVRVDEVKRGVTCEPDNPLSRFRLSDEKYA